MIEIRAIGGYKEFGRNMTALIIDNKTIILDMGIHLENYINLTEDEDLIKISRRDLENADAIPKIDSDDKIRKNAIAIISTHGHLDHIGAIPFMAKSFKCPIYATPFTCEVIKTLYEDEKLKLKNPLKKIKLNSSFKLGDDLSVEFISVAHSTPQTVMIAVHTKYGTVLYGNDFKKDHNEILGEVANFKRLTELGNSGKVLALICDSTYSKEDKSTDSELIARDLLKSVLESGNYEGRVILISTFSSHLARLNSIISSANKIKRNVVFMGRSLWKYTHAGEVAGIVDYSNIERYKYRSEINKKLRQIMSEGPDKYVLVVTGHQGERKAILSRIANDETPLKLMEKDVVIFSSSVIPVESNILHRELLEKSLEKKKVQIYKDIHVSGHAAGDDITYLIEITKPKHIIPSHGELKMLEGVRELSIKKGYDKSTIHILSNGESVIID